MFLEIVGRRPLPDDLDRDDVEDPLSEALDDHGEVTGAGSGPGSWHLDVEIDGAAPDQVARRLAKALTAMSLGWVTLRLAHENSPHTVAEWPAATA